MPRAFDESELLERVDNDWEFLGETVQMLASDGPALLEGIRQAAAACDAPAVGRAAHALKGMVSNFCSPETHASAAAVEALGKAGDLAPLPPALEALDARLKGLIAELSDFVASRA